MILVHDYLPDTMSKQAVQDTKYNGMVMYGKL